MKNKILVFIKEYKSKTPILSKIEDTLSNLYQPVVTLPSGGYIVINPTEALTAIDVNSGKSTKENSIEIDEIMAILTKPIYSRSYDDLLLLNAYISKQYLSNFNFQSSVS